MKRLLLVAVVLTGCKLSCLAPRAEVIDAPIAAQLQAVNKDDDGPVDDAGVGDTFDHSTFDALVKAHARPASGRVDYAALKRDEPQLDSYLDQLATADLASLSRAEHEALLINAYNAFTLKLISENYPEIASIKDLSSPWKQSRWNLAGQMLSLDDIEHGLLRPIYEDARIHFAVNCASIGCPPLADTAYVGEKLDAQLEAATRAALNTPRYAKVDGGVLYVTALMNWYGPDFGDLPTFVRKYRDDVPAEPSVEFLDYDWSLNDTRRNE